ncbi:hypothetical protein, partial [Klebsiella pneumoniae]|uniref:hypothetical protein n=1 Tax=Klebsiella pneumoniae TaxID=573 RepID=UPI00209BE29E
KRAYCLKTQPATGETYPKSDLFNKARNNVRAAYIHTSEHLDERRLMVQWWADYLKSNEGKIVTPYEFAKIRKS